MCQIKAYLLILNTGSSAVLSPGVSGPVTSTRHVHPAGIKPEEKCVNSQNKRSGMEKKCNSVFSVLQFVLLWGHM